MSLLRFIKVIDTETKTLFKNTSWVLGGNVFRSLLVFLRGIIIARGLGVELYGIFTIIAVFTSSVHQFFHITINSTIIKFGANYLSQKQFNKLGALLKASYISSFVIAIFSTLVISILTLFLYNVFITEPDLEKYIIAYAIISSSIFVDGISVTFMRLLYKFKENSIMNSLIAAFDLILIGLVILVIPNNFEAFFYAILISKLLGTLFLNFGTVYILKDYLMPFIKKSIVCLKEEKREMINFTIANSGSKAMKTFITNGDVLLLMSFLGPVPVAFYNIAKKLAQVILIFVDPLTNTIFPQLSMLISDKRYGEVRDMINRMTKLLILPSIAFLLVTYGLKEELIRFTYGKEYLEASKPFFLLTINAIISSILFWNLPLILSLGLAKFRFVISAISLVIGGFVAYLTIPYLETIGAALGLLIANGLITIVFSLVAYSKIKNVEPIKMTNNA